MDLEGLHIDHSSAVLLYHQIKENLQDFIERGELNANGAIRNADDLCRHASLQNDPNLTDLVYTDGYALVALQEAYQATGEPRFREAADRLADFLVRVQCREESPLWNGGWRDAYDVNTLEPRDRANQENSLDEGGMYSVYTGWCAAPITYGLLRRELWQL